MAIKHLALIALLFLTPVLARADNIVAVSLNPFDYGVQVLSPGHALGDEIVAVTFTWDTTTEVISNIVIATTGPFQGVQIPGAINLNSNNLGDSLWFGTAKIGRLVFVLTSSVNPSPIIYTLDYSLHAQPGSPFAGLPGAPGTYFADENLDCGFCFAGDENSEFATATVSPVSTPEPNTALLLGAGIIVLVLMIGAVRSRGLTTLCSSAALRA
jgi:hypothetical protein